MSSREVKLSFVHTLLKYYPNNNKLSLKNKKASCIPIAPLTNRIDTLIPALFNTLIYS